MHHANLIKNHHYTTTRSKVRIRFIFFSILLETFSKFFRLDRSWKFFLLTWWILNQLLSTCVIIIMWHHDALLTKWEWEWKFWLRPCCGQRDREEQRLCRRLNRWSALGATSSGNWFSDSITLWAIDQIAMSWRIFTGTIIAGFGIHALGPGITIIITRASRTAYSFLSGHPVVACLYWHTQSYVAMAVMTFTYRSMGTDTGCATSALYWVSGVVINDFISMARGRPSCNGSLTDRATL